MERRAVDEDPGKAPPPGPREAPAQEGAVEDEGRAHEAPDMVPRGRRGNPRLEASATKPAGAGCGGATCGCLSDG